MKLSILLILLCFPIIGFSQLFIGAQASHASTFRLNDKNERSYGTNYGLDAGLNVDFAFLKLGKQHFEVRTGALLNDRYYEDSTVLLNSGNIRIPVGIRWCLDNDTSNVTMTYFIGAGYQANIPYYVAVNNIENTESYFNQGVFFETGIHFRLNKYVRASTGIALALDLASTSSASSIYKFGDGSVFFGLSVPLVK